MDEDIDLNLLRAIARSEGLQNGKVDTIDKPTAVGNKKYFPILKHPLPVSISRHDHEKALCKVMSTPVEYQGIAAITLGDAWALEEVFMRSGDIVLKGKNGSYPIHVAVQLNSIDCVMVLIHIGVDINKSNALGFTPLQLAKSSGHSQMETLLLQHKAQLYCDAEAEKVINHKTVLDVIPERHSSSIRTKSSNAMLNEFNNIPAKSTFF
eukprot:gene24238-32670_t